MALRLKIRNTTDVGRAIEQWAKAMSQSDIRWGLLIYRTATIDLTNIVCMPNVLVISAEQFLERLQDERFADLIRRLRNQRVHGYF